MNSRERVIAAINHQVPDRVPLDLGAGPTTGMHVSSVYLLRQGLGLDEPGTPVKVIEPYQMLGEIKPDLQEMLGVDVVGVSAKNNFFGFKNQGWKPWTTFDGTPVLVPALFNTDQGPDGNIFMYPEGDTSEPPSAVMPEGGFYFDAILRQHPIDDNKLNVQDNLEEFSIISEEDLDYFQSEIEALYHSTDKAILANFGGTAFGDIGLVPAPWLKDPKGIRDVTEWYISTVSRKDYVYKIFEKQCEIALENLKRLYERIGNKIHVIYMTGTDFGAQNGLFISPKSYNDLYRPFHEILNNWVHENTEWKIFIHSCGSIIKLLPDFVEAGFDILNPVQTSAKGMDPQLLKDQFGEQLVFWGGGVDTQKVLPYGTPKEVEAQVEERIKIFGAGGGFVFNPIHNVQASIPQENLMALYQAFITARESL